MSWRGSNIYFLAPGASMGIRFWYGSGEDKGAQWAMAHPLPEEPVSPLMTERVGKRLICEIENVTTGKCEVTGSKYEYLALFTNDGSATCRFQFEGGGV